MTRRLYLSLPAAFVFAIAALFAFAEANPLAVKLNNKGVALLNAGDTQGAIEALSAAFTHDSDSAAILRNYAQALNNRGVELGRAGEYRQAEGYLRKAFALEPKRQDLGRNLSVIRTNWATAQSEAGAFDQAESLYVLSLETATTDQQAAIASLRANNLVLSGRDRKQKGETEWAIRLLETASEIDPSCLAAVVDLGQLFQAEGDSELALAYLELALLLDPSLASLKDRIAKLRREVETERNFNTQSNIHFEVSYEGGVNDAAASAVLNILTRARRDLGHALRLFPHKQIQVVLYTRDQYANVTMAPHWSGGVYDGKIRVPLAGDETSDAKRPQLQAMLYHEYAHALVRDIAGAQIPTWLNEGVATYYELDSLRRPLRYEKEKITMRILKKNDELTKIKDLPDSFVAIQDRKKAEHVYAVSRTFTTWLIERHSATRLRGVLNKIGEGLDVETAVRDVYGRTLESLDMEWRRSL